MSLSPSRVADVCDTTAALLDEHGADTTRIVNEWAGTGSAASLEARVSGGSSSDPTGDTAFATPPPGNAYAARAAPWPQTHGAVVRVYVRLGNPHPRTATTGAASTHLRAIARTIRKRNRVDQKFLTGIEAICLEVWKIIGATHPMTTDEARAELLADAKLANQASYCRSCRTPGPTTSARCEPCRSALRRQQEAGLFVDDDTFDRTIREQIAANAISRPGSPLWADTRTHELEAGDYRCPTCDARQTLTRGGGTTIGCLVCGTAMEAA